MPIDSSTDPYDPGHDVGQAAGNISLPDVKSFDDDDDLDKAGTGATKGFDAEPDGGSKLDQDDDDLLGAGSGAKHFDDDVVSGTGGAHQSADVLGGDELDTKDLGVDDDPFSAKLGAADDDDVVDKSLHPHADVDDDGLKHVGDDHDDDVDVDGDKLDLHDIFDT